MFKKLDLGATYGKKVVIDENSKVILPWNKNGNHWIVVIIDFNTKECFFMDPIKPVDIDNRVNENNFKKLCIEMKQKCVYGVQKDFPSLNLIMCPIENIPEQTDDYNCGVFVIYYVFTILCKNNLIQNSILLSTGDI